MLSFMLQCSPEDSGRFPEACLEACFIFDYILSALKDTGRVPEACCAAGSASGTSLLRIL